MSNHGYEQLAREVVIAALGSGSWTPTGDPAEQIAELYGKMARSLYRIEMDVGTTAMDTSAHLAIAAMNAGLLYASEANDFTSRIAQGVRDISRELDDRPRGIS